MVKIQIVEKPEQNAFLDYVNFCTVMIEKEKPQDILVMMRAAYPVWVGVNKLLELRNNPIRERVILVRPTWAVTRDFSFPFENMDGKKLTNEKFKNKKVVLIEPYSMSSQGNLGMLFSLFKEANQIICLSNCLQWAGGIGVLMLRSFRNKTKNFYMYFRKDGKMFSWDMANDVYLGFKHSDKLPCIPKEELTEKYKEIENLVEGYYIRNGNKLKIRGNWEHYKRK